MCCACLLTIGLVQALLEEVYTNRCISFYVVQKAVLRIVEGNLWDHMWYVYTIIGVYLIMPVLHTFIRSSKTNAWTLTAVLFLFAVLAPSLEKWVHPGLKLPVSGYLFYVCAGGTAAQYAVSRKAVALCCMLGLASAVCTAVCPTETAGYLDPTVCFMAVSAFLLCCQWRGATNRFLRSAAQCTWGIYLLHPFIINIVIKVLRIDLLSSAPLARIPAFAIITVCLSFGLTCLLRKLPLLRQIL